MRFAALTQALAYMTVLPFDGATAIPVVDTPLNYSTTDATLVSRSSRAPCVADDPTVRNILLDMHNKERMWHHAPPLEWDDTLASFAQSWADTCPSGHSAGSYGENAYCITPSIVVDDWHKQTMDAMHAWIGEVYYYPWHEPKYSEKTGHFSQVIWKDTQKIGCAWSTAECGGPNGQTWLFCEFQPGGNVIGDFKANTLPH